jgi:tRNA (guanine37-N1)-methyltransferase
MKVHALTIFPEVFDSFLTYSVIGKALYKGHATIEVVDFREFSLDKHRKVDDYPYGGGAGMLLQVEPIHRALQSIEGYQTATKVVMTPQGTPLTQAVAERLSKVDHLIVLAGHYEGFDERVLGYFDEEISIGDYVLTGGEYPAMILLESVIRLLDGTLHNPESTLHDSFQTPRLEGAQYTRPEEYQGQRVPEVLLNGHHALIQQYHLKESLRRTWLRRPELLTNLTQEEQRILEEIKQELEASKKL